MRDFLKDRVPTIIKETNQTDDFYPNKNNPKPGWQHMECT